MRVLISGANGTIGRALARALAADGHASTRLVRREPRGAGEFRWDPATGFVDAAAAASCDAIVHLAGAGIAAGRWSASRKAAIMESRRLGTRAIVGAMGRAAPPPRVLVCASGIGIYGDRGDEVLTEESAPGAGFLADVGRAWEGEAGAAADAGTRVVCLRTGLVLTMDGGALPLMRLPFLLGLGGPLGSGRHWLSWITLADHLRVIRHALERDDLAGPVNAVSPHPVTHADFSRALAAALARPAVLRVPAWSLRLLLGEMGQELLLSSQRAVPARLAAAGFTFEDPEIGQALRRVCNARR